MLIEKVKELSVKERFYYWIKERTKIRNKKQENKPKPWTNDSILQSYRFCNVIRMEDKVSEWLLRYWYIPYFNHSNMLVSVALARFLNQIPSLDHVGFPKKWAPEAIKTKMREYRDDPDSPTSLFSAAYMVRGGDSGGEKVSDVVDRYCNPLFVSGLQKQIPTYSMEESHALIKEQYGFGSFNAGQVVADLRWAMKGSWKDARYWAPVGPGSSRGMARLLEEGVKPSRQTRIVSQDTFLPFLQDLIAEGKKRSDLLPLNIVDRMEAQDWQNCLCEFDKYERVLWGEGRPKQKYPGAE